MQTDAKKLYSAKARDSFKTKMNLFIYESVLGNKTKLSIDDFKKFVINKNIVDEYVTVYWQQQKAFEIRGKKIENIEVLIKDFESLNEIEIRVCRDFYCTEEFPQIFPFRDFQLLIENEHCYYCGITEKQIEELGDRRLLKKKNLRGWTLEIDRFDSNIEYKKENCVMACYWCNNAKTDEFTEVEFKYLGQAIGNILKNRLGNSKKSEPLTDEVL